MIRSFAFQRACVGLAVVAVSFALVNGAVGQEKTNKRSSAKSDRGYTIANETTFFTGPLKPDGSIDFVAAVNEHYSKGVTPENNAARIIVPLLNYAEFGSIDDSRRDGVLESLGLDPADHPIERAFHDVGPYFKRDASKIQAFDKQYFETQVRPWTASEFPQVAQWLSDNEDALNRIAEGATKEKYFVPWKTDDESDALYYILLDHVQATRSIARAFQARINLQIGEQNWQGAWGDVLTMRNLGRLVGQGPSLIEGLVGIAITGMACESAKQFVVAADVDAVDWSELQESWTVTPIARIPESLGISERAMLIQMICRFADFPDQAASDIPISSGSFGEFASMLSNKAFARTLHDMVHSGEVPLDDALRYVNGMYDRATEISKMTDTRRRLEALKQLDNETNHTAREGESSLVGMFVSKPEPPATQFAKAMLNAIFPAVESVNAAELRTEGSLHVIELALAARGIQARTGNLPMSLRELEPWADRPVMEQPLTGDPIELRFDRGELLIYHWANNRQDDGGECEPQNPLDWGLRIRE